MQFYLFVLDNLYTFSLSFQSTKLNICIRIYVLFRERTEIPCWRLKQFSPQQTRSPSREITKSYSITVIEILVHKYESTRKSQE